MTDRKIAEIQSWLEMNPLATDYDRARDYVRYLLFKVEQLQAEIEDLKSDLAEALRAAR
jgi:hypothetical protein